MPARRKARPKPAAAPGRGALLALLDRLPATVFLCRADGVVAYANPALARLCGPDCPVPAGRHFRDCLAGPNADAVAGLLAGLGPDEPERTADTCVVHADGRADSLRWTARGEFGPDGGLREVQVTGLPQPGVLEAERLRLAELRQAERLADNLPDIVARFDRGLRHLYVNSALLRSAGVDPATLLGRTNREAGMPEHLATQWEADLRRVFATGRPQTVSFTFPAPGGPRRYESRHIPEFGEDGSVATVLCITRDMSDLDAAQAMLRESEERWRALFQAATGVKLLVDPADGRIVEANQAASDFYGYPLEALRAMRLFQLNALPEEQVRRNLATVAGKRQQRFLVPHRLASGEVRTMDIYACPVQVDGRTLNYAVMHDVTEATQAGERLRASEEGYRALFERSRDGIAVFAVSTSPPDARLVDCNPALLDLLGVERDTLLARGTIFSEQIIAHTPSRQESLEQLLSRGEAQGSYTLRGPDGRNRTVDWLGMRMAGKEHDLYVVFHRDVTERARREEERTRAEQAMRRVLGHFPFVLWATDADTVLTLSEGRGLERLGFRSGELVGRSHRDDLHRDNPRALAPILRCLAGEEFTATVETGGVTFETRYTPMRDDSGRVAGMLGVSQDVTDRKRAEERVRQLKALALAAQENERGRLSRELHDSVLQSLGSARMLLERSRDALPPDPGLDRVLEMLTDMARDTRRTVMRLRPVVLEDLGLAAALSWLCDSYREDHPQAAVACRIGAEPGLDPEDKTALFRIAQEALANAGRHSGASRIRVELRVLAGGWLLRVGDNGRGFDVPAVLQMMQAGGGFGLLGMQERAAIAGIRLRIASRPGRWAWVTAWLPRPGKRAASDA